jgi:hypothetical protein
MPVPPAFDGFVEQGKRVSPTCLISFERNRYSIPASFANRPVSLTFKSPMWITPMPPDAQRARGKGHMGQSQWKLRACPGQFRVKINRDDLRTKICPGVSTIHSGHYPSLPASGRAVRPDGY